MTKRSKDYLRKHLDEQLELLELLCDAFDSGKTVASIKIASIVRVLLHDTEKSHSLLNQLDLKSVNFFDSCSSLGDRENEKDYKRLGSFAGIVGMGIGSNPDYLPYLDELPSGKHEMVSFDEYWKRIVLVDNLGSIFTRRKIILTISNKEGGAHIDPKIDKKYDALANKNSMGWRVDKGDGIERVLDGIELATVRQIGHEVLRTLRPEMKEKKMNKKGATIVVGGIGFWVGKAVNKVASTVPRKYPKVGRNEKCPCGSNLKYKKCHGV